MVKISLSICVALTCLADVAFCQSAGVIAGTILRFGTSEPIPDVLITITGPTAGVRGNPQSARTTTTGGGGQFIIPDVPPGRYIVRAERAGYYSPEVSQAGSSPFPNTTARYVSQVVVVSAGQQSRVTLVLTAPGSVAGRIVDVNGKPLPDVRVVALRLQYIDGQAQLSQPSPVGTDTARDLRSIAGERMPTSDINGEYRIKSLPTGQYYILAEEDQDRRRIANQSQEYAHTYYPGTAQLATAMPVTVVGGADLPAVDIQMQLAKGFTVSGRVINAVDLAKRFQPVIAFFLAPRDPNTITEPLPLYTNEADDKSNGRFELRNVPPGSYDLFPIVSDLQNVTYTSPTAIDVNDRAIQDLTATVHSHALLNGHLVGDGFTLGSTFSLSLRPASTIPNAMPQSKRANSEFSFDNLNEGNYRLSIGAPPGSGLYVADIRQAARSVIATGVVAVSGDPEAVQILIRSGVGKIDGYVQDASQKGVEHALVVLVPQFARNNGALYKRATSDPKGRFSISDIPPGEYKAFAWESIPAGADENVDFIARYEQLGQKLTINANDNANVQIKIIPASLTR